MSEENVKVEEQAVAETPTQENTDSKSVSLDHAVRKEVSVVKARLGKGFLS